MRINFKFRELLDMELYEKGFQHWVIRIIARTRFKTQEGWTEVKEAILDTGAPTSALPRDLWERIIINRLVDYTISGIVPMRGMRPERAFGRDRMYPA